jgi:hypothetical protein
MKTWITAKVIDDRLRALKTLREPACRVVCLYLPNEPREHRGIASSTARRLETPSAKTAENQRRAA